ncbi:type IV secretion system protein [Paracoccus pantotrophus]|uniref:type IV secretion system protein n=1 Tax=Paracoccus pantotrophus TaxID=82367 RepID=UPI0008EB2173|nr:type IV secretion system protein [Paracoccus pantotrophus]MDF3855626.1 type IV secretion system protein [Paracoccus pantotrophus]SFP05179.1 TrbL/VirB6 plasmid conjugal transfer protein [Paracoccus pantotrophus]
MGIVTDIMTTIDNSIMSAGQKFFEATASGMQPVMTIATTILLILIGINMAVGYYQISGRDSLQLATRIVMIYIFAFSWSNFSVVYQAFAHTGDTLAMEFFNVASSTSTSSIYGAMDKVAADMSDAADGVARSQGSIMRGVLGAAFYIFLAALMAIYVLIVAFAKIMIAVLLGIAPLAIVATIFERTKNLFEAWLESLVGYLMYPIAASSVISVIVVVAQDQFVEQDNVQTINQLLGFTVVVFVGIFALKAIPDAAGHMTGHFRLSTIAPDAMRMGQRAGSAGVMNLPGVKKLQQYREDRAKIKEGYKNNSADSPQQIQKDRDRALRERGMALRQRRDDMRKLRGAT